MRFDSLQWVDQTKISLEFPPILSSKFWHNFLVTSIWCKSSHEWWCCKNFTALDDYDLADFYMGAERLNQSGLLSQYLSLSKREAGSVCTSFRLYDLTRRCQLCLRIDMLWLLQHCIMEWKKQNEIWCSAQLLFNSLIFRKWLKLLYFRFLIYKIEPIFHGLIQF